MIGFKSISAIDDWASIHPLLREVITFILSDAWPTDRDLVITRIAERDPNQVTEIHTCGPPHRAADIRIFNVPYQTVERAVAKINLAFRYDGDRPKQVAILHDAGSGNHLHIQVSNNTVRVGATHDS